MKQHYVSKKSWTSEETSFLKQNFPIYGERYCFDFFKSRTIYAIISKARALNLRHPNNHLWLDDDVEWLKLNYFNGVKFCADFLKRKPTAIRTKAWELRITKPKDYSLILTKEFLEKEHSILGKSLRKISQEIGCGQMIIKKYLMLHNIPFVSHRNSAKFGKSSAIWNGHQEIYGSYWSQLRHGAKTRKILFNITIQQAWDLFLKQNKKCALSGEILTFRKRASNTASQTASLDRIDSNKGYEIENV